MEAFSKEYVKNKYYISVVKCCASCSKHVATSVERVCICQITGQKHPIDYLCCSGWEMNPALDNAGRGGGMVKKPSYIEYFKQHGPGHEAEFELLFGSRYLTSR